MTAIRGVFIGTSLLLIASTRARPVRRGVIHAVDRDGKLEWRTKSRYLLTEIIGIPPERANKFHGARLGVVMRKLGWTGPKDMRFGKEKAKGYAKSTNSE